MPPAGVGDSIMQDELTVSGGSVRGEVVVPGDKSISHRAALFAALANGPGRISNFLDAEDTRALLGALARVGIRAERAGSADVIVHGRGAAGWDDPSRPLDLGNSGTALRLLAGVLAGRGVRAVLTGDASLRSRPMDRIVAPLAAMGARVSARDGRAPLTLGGGALRGTTHRVPVASAQVVSCVLLAGLHADGKTRVDAPPGWRDHTERMMESYGLPLYRDRGRVGTTRVDWDACAARDVTVPRDPSAAAFFAVAAAIVPGAEVVLPGLCANRSRTGFVEVLRRMGAECEWANRVALGGEPVADLHVRHRRLRAVRIERDEVPALIDELPVLAVAAACAEGTTRLAGAGELRYKESDRLATTTAMLRSLGITVHSVPDGLMVEGGALRSGAVDAADDHRVAMAAAVAALRAPGPVTIRRSAAIATSFPGFVAVARAAGMEIG